MIRDQTVNALSPTFDDCIGFATFQKLPKIIATNASINENRAQLNG